MPLPVNFSEWEHFQGLLMSLQNRIVKKEFSDVPHEDGQTVNTWGDITVPRSSLKVGCWLKDSDTTIITILIQV
mgnify:CR=1 FL=1